MLVGRARPAIPVRRVNDVANHSSTRPLVHLTRLLVNLSTRPLVYLDKMDDSGMEFLSYFCIGMCKEYGVIKKISLTCLCLRKYFIYLHRCTQSAARHYQEAFGYSAMVNLDNSLCNRNNRNAPFGMIIYRADI